jgi:hypothetical protein
MLKNVSWAVAAAATLVLAVPATAHAAPPFQWDFLHPFALVPASARDLAVQPLNDRLPTLPVLAESDNGKQQQWVGVNADNNRFRFRNLSNNACLSAPSVSRPGEAIEVSECWGYPDERFYPMAGPHGSATIAAANGMCLDAQRGGPPDGLYVVLNKCSGAASQLWLLPPVQQ